MAAEANDGQIIIDTMLRSPEHRFDVLPPANVLMTYFDSDYKIGNDGDRRLIINALGEYYLDADDKQEKGMAVKLINYLRVDGGYPKLFGEALPTEYKKKDVWKNTTGYQKRYLLQGAEEDSDAMDSGEDDWLDVDIDDDYKQARILTRFIYNGNVDEAMDDPCIKGLEVEKNALDALLAKDLNKVNINSMYNPNNLFDFNMKTLSDRSIKNKFFLWLLFKDQEVNDLEYGVPRRWFKDKLGGVFQAPTNIPVSKRPRLQYDDTMGIIDTKIYTTQNIDRIIYMVFDGNIHAAEGNADVQEFVDFFVPKYDHAEFWGDTKRRMKSYNDNCIRETIRWFKEWRSLNLDDDSPFCSWVLENYELIKDIKLLPCRLKAAKLVMTRESKQYFKREKDMIMLEKSEIDKHNILLHHLNPIWGIIMKKSVHPILLNGDLLTTEPTNNFTPDNNDMYHRLLGFEVILGAIQGIIKNGFLEFSFVQKGVPVPDYSIGQINGAIQNGAYLIVKNVKNGIRQTRTFGPDDELPTGNTLARWRQKNYDITLTIYDRVGGLVRAITQGELNRAVDTAVSLATDKLNIVAV